MDDNSNTITYYPTGIGPHGVPTYTAVTNQTEEQIADQVKQFYQKFADKIKNPPSSEWTGFTKPELKD